MKAVVLHGGPRKDGNTIKLTQKFMDGLRSKDCEVSFIDTTKLKVSPCTGCLYCEKTGNCIIQDEMQSIYEKVIDSDIIILSSPIYFASVTAQLKTVIDRFQTLFGRRYILKQDMEKQRKGYVIFTAGGKNEKMIDSIELLSKFFLLSCNAKLNKSIYAMNLDEVNLEDDILNMAFLEGQMAVEGI